MLFLCIIFRLGKLSGILVSVRVILYWTMRFGKSSVLRRKFCYNKLCFSVDPLMT